MNKKGGKKFSEKNVVFDCDVLVIGSGAAGISAAFSARGSGKKVIITEQDKVGGECPNYACVPTKALITSAKAYYFLKNEYPILGVKCEKPMYSFAKIMKYKQSVVSAVTGDGKRLGNLLGQNRIKLIKGSARFIDKHTVKVNKKKIKARFIVIATGVENTLPPIDGIEKTPYYTYKEIMDLKKQPKSVAIIGGGPVGCELATFFSLIGTKVTIFEVMPHILGSEDEEISLLASKQMQNHGTNIFTNTKVLSSKKVGKKVELVYQQGKKKRESMQVDLIVIAAGRKPRVENLHLDSAGIKIDARGRLIVNDYLQTSQKHIFAAGDVTSKMQFTHTAHRDGGVVGWNVCVNNKAMKKIDNRVVPRVTFTMPEVASVGMTQKDAKEAGYKITVKSFPVGALGRAVTENKREGLIKVVLKKETNQILGAQIIGQNAGEVIHELALGMYLNAKFDDIQSMLHAFPTYSEAIVAI